MAVVCSKNCLGVRRVSVHWSWSCICICWMFVSPAGSFAGFMVLNAVIPSALLFRLRSGLVYS